jgi:hypothetical protein
MDFPKAGQILQANTLWPGRGQAIDFGSQVSAILVPKEIISV